MLIANHFRNLTGRFLALSFLCLAACTQADPINEIDPRIEAHVAAFNEADFERIEALQHPDIEWFGIDQDQMTLEMSGRDDLLVMLRAYREGNPTVTGHLSEWSRVGNFVSVVETARWQDDDGTAMEQKALAVYEFEDDLIRRVWYYPAVRD